MAGIWVHLCAVSDCDTAFSQYGKPGKTEEKSNCGRTCPGHHFDGIRLCGSRTGKKSLSAGTGGRCFREWLCAEICNAGYEYSYRTGKTGRRSDFCADSFRPGLQEIEAVYNRSQEKFLDLGHLEVLILDEQILEEGSREALIGYLKQEEHIGEDVYVFRTDMLGDVFHWKGARESSIGEYLQESRRTAHPGSRRRV